MFSWKVEDMKLLNTKNHGGVYVGGNYVFPEMSKVSREDKIQFIDSMNKGVMTHLLNLIKQWNKDVDTLPKDSWGSVKTVSLKAWIKRNDKCEYRNGYSLLDDDYKYGKFHILGCERWIQHDPENKGAQYDTYDDIVDEIFYRQLNPCLKEEEAYFKSVDPYEIAKSKLKKYVNKYHTYFGIRLVFSSDDTVVIPTEPERWKGPEITLDQANILVKMFEQLDATIEDLTSKTSEEFKKLEEY